MDLYNNNVGRQMALDPRNRDRPPEEVIREALRARASKRTSGCRASLGNDPDVAYVVGTPGRYGRRYGGSPVKGSRDPRRR